MFVLACPFWLHRDSGVADSASSWRFTGSGNEAFQRSGLELWGLGFRESRAFVACKAQLMKRGGHEPSALEIAAWDLHHHHTHTPRPQKPAHGLRQSVGTLDLRRVVHSGAVFVLVKPQAPQSVGRTLARMAA